mmetsp:Transcript_27614/g.82689  ORF Transcript_27614/g.82689 Transcript_27614/m.82689 type:complete len:91 (+) Transcript_27614:1210-1482(+)
MGVRSGREVSQDLIFKRDNGVHVTSLAEVHKNYFAKLKPGQLLSEEGLAETSSAMRRWWAAGRVMHEESRDASGDGYDYREDVSVKLAAV